MKMEKEQVSKIVLSLRRRGEYGTGPKGQQGPEIDRRRHSRRPIPREKRRRPRRGH